MAVTCFVALGANLGNALETVQRAIAAIAGLPDTRLLSQSSLYHTAPFQAVGPDFINAVVEISTDLPAHDLLAHLQGLENAELRLRPYRNAPRTLDLDILLYGDLLIQTAALQVPHPRMNQRAFVLQPLAQIAPERVSAAQLQAVSDQAIERLNA